MRSSSRSLASMVSNELCDQWEDLVSESVHQEVVGALDRAGSSLDDLATGAQGPQPRPLRDLERNQNGQIGDDDQADDTEPDPLCEAWDLHCGHRIAFR